MSRAILELSRSDLGAHPAILLLLTLRWSARHTQQPCIKCLENDGQAETGYELKSFSKVVLLGEPAGDRLLYDVLKGVLSKQQQQTDYLPAATVDGRKGLIDSVFAPSMGAA